MVTSSLSVEQTPAAESPLTSESPYKDHASDLDSQPQISPTSSISMSSDTNDPAETKYCKKPKFIVFDSKLEEFLYLMQCPKCSSGVSEIQKSFQGTMVMIISLCNSGHTDIEWSSQPCIGKAAVRNLLSAAVISFSGNMYTNISYFINLLGVKFFSHTLFYDIQGKHFIPVVNSFYLSQTEDILSSLSESDLQLMGDGRCGSPGYSGKYCSYTM
ncbi:hypothetical protein HOLleu_00710 [Holothuria leucospilota]|uniref:Uncharacterized protein n=1 Tax=Holothuria leucospilota TaxID=206669 RepID=A0A9Q1HKE4_HOLLE|nr:hypothetical protein HOLleu_00710 [Holothuria leucospilota]